MALSIIVCLNPHPYAPLASGIVVGYARNVMEGVAANRHMQVLPWVAGLASTRFCYRVDTKGDPTLRQRPYVALVSINGGPPEIYQIVDCSDPRDLDDHIKWGLFLEVDHKSAVRHRLQPGHQHVIIWRIWRL